MKKQYQKGGLGDVAVKKYLIEEMDKILKPIRERREELAKDPEAIYKMLEEGSVEAQKAAAETLQEVKRVMKIDYFGDKNGEI